MIKVINRLIIFLFGIYIKFKIIMFFTLSWIQVGRNVYTSKSNPTFPSWKQTNGHNLFLWNIATYLRNTVSFTAEQLSYISMQHAFKSINEITSVLYAIIFTWHFRFGHADYCILMPHWWTVVAVRSKAYVCSRSSARIAGSNSTEDMNVRLLCLLCVVHVVASATRWQRSLLSVCVCVCVCLFVCVFLIVSDLKTWTVRQPATGIGYSTTEKKVTRLSKEYYN
jgi:hypothetical protein